MNKSKMRLINTLTNQLEEFSPLNPNLVTWYTCGPTVYDHSHIGHARNYICTDALRRTLTHWYGYNIYFVMNVTDVDDKIIKKSMDQGEHFLDVTKRYTKSFMDDMKKLNVRLPDSLTYVSDYVEEIKEYTQKIIDNGYAYVANDGSVYFDTDKYIKESGFKYGKLKEFDAELLKEGEGALTAETEVKKSSKDFALWKASKENEPYWDSQFGKGRPGWHIECSVMAHATIGTKLDIHTGGIDLKFPHHENEIAQCEAHNLDSWVKYFLHVGHLEIKGKKMAKSLKNFVLISDLLDNFNYQTIRIYFLNQSYDGRMNHTEEGLEYAKTKEANLRSFIDQILIRLRYGDAINNVKLSPAEMKLIQLIKNSYGEVDKAFSNNFKSQDAIASMFNVISEFNNFYNTNRDASKSNFYLTSYVKKYLEKVLLCLGLIHGETIETYHSSHSSTSGISESTQSILDSTIAFRNTVRKTAITTKDTNLTKICDELRDDLMELGVKIMDSGEDSVWQIQDKDELIKEKQEKASKAEADELRKQKANEEKNQKAQEKKEKAKINPQEMFKNDKEYEGYEFDEMGIPIKDNTGADVTKNQLKKLKKIYDTQKKLYDEYLKNNN